MKFRSVGAVKVKVVQTTYPIRNMGSDEMIISYSGRADKGCGCETEESNFRFNVRLNEKDSSLEELLDIKPFTCDWKELYLRTQID